MTIGNVCCRCSIWVAIILISLPLAVKAEMYKWVDEHGNVHYGDKPRPQADQVEVQRQSGLGMDREDVERINREHERQIRENLEAREASRKADEAKERQAKLNEKRCERYRGYVEDYEEKRREGCQASRCEYYRELIEKYERKAAQYCR